jgi:hypothetical protein
MWTMTSTRLSASEGLAIGVMERAVGAEWVIRVGDGSERSLVAMVDAAVVQLNAARASGQLQRAEPFTSSDSITELMQTALRLQPDNSLGGTVGIVGQMRADIGRELRASRQESERLFGPVPDDGHELDVYIDRLMSEVRQAAERVAATTDFDQDEVYGLLVELAEGNGLRD